MLGRTIRLFLADEAGGERDTLTTLLILALIILPLLLVIIVFSKEIAGYVQEQWNAIVSDKSGAVEGR